MIFIHFDTITDKAGLRGRFSCELLISQQSLVKLSGTADIAQCVFVNTTMLAISVCSGATLEMNEKITIAPRISRGLRQQIGCLTPSGPMLASEGTICFATSLSASNDVRVERPDNPVAPVAVLKGPSLIGPCEDLIMDASSSYGSAGRPLQYYFGLVPGSANDEVLRAHIFSISHAPYLTNKITIPGNTMVQGASYSFMVSRFCFRVYVYANFNQPAFVICS